MIEPDAAKPRTHAVPVDKIRAWTVRKMALTLVLAAVLALVGLHDAGYAILIGGGGAGETAKNGMAQLSCTYFTGTERVINHILRPTADTARAAHCPLMAKLDKPAPAMDDGLIP